MIVSYNLVWRFYALSSETAQGHGAIIQSLLKTGEDSSLRCKILYLIFASCLKFWTNTVRHALRRYQKKNTYDVIFGQKGTDSSLRMKKISTD